MNISIQNLKFIVTYILISGSLWTASEWWEKGLAKQLGHADISPNGCYRVEIFAPFWVLPMMLHRKPDPNNDIPPKILPSWSYPGFYRLYDQRSGKLIGESHIYDLESASGTLYWGDKIMPKVIAGFIYIGPNLQDCIGDQLDNATQKK
ncbi:hypothetical protein NVV30_16525 [Pseudomonas syringae]|uniref:hypothetical protein n=1 Tax=Pseudomonas syringae TaxID=317 RepID=UPI00215A1B2A|nr:hypothetical protein [Pseudomonas syringae]MCR8720288.1 hypothetical protein [Pseudomonas syringae]